MTHLKAILYKRKWYTFADACAFMLKQLDHGNFQNALDVSNLILEMKPDHAVTYVNRGIALHSMQRFEEALESYDKALAINPNLAEIHCNRGITLDNMNRFDHALASYDKAIELNPHYAGSYFYRGKVLVIKGQIQEAEQMFLKALALKPDFFKALVELTDIRKYQERNHPDVYLVRSLQKNINVSARNRGFLNYCLGKIHDDCGEYAEAFEYYRQANQVTGSLFPYDAGRITSMTTRTIHVFNKVFLSRPFESASNDQTPLFIVGMPRSGTTLLANVLSNHRSIGTAGELETINDFALRLPGLVENHPAYPEAANDVTGAVSVSLTHDYLERLKRDVGAGFSYIIDKHPLNFRHLGLIAKLFPNAKIVHCTRHPLDTGLSNYFQRFTSGYEYSFDLKNIGHFYGEYLRIMDHWKKVLPMDIIEVCYEDLINDTEKVTRKTLGSLGLEWDENCLVPQSNPSAVRTASNWQVRQPIHKNSIGRWKHYEQQLSPLKEMLHLS